MRAQTQTAADYGYEYLLQVQQVFLEQYPDYLLTLQKIQGVIDITLKIIAPEFAASLSTVDGNIPDLNLNFLR